MSRLLAALLVFALPLTAARAGDSITIPAAVPFLEGTGIPNNIKQECGLPEALTQELQAQLAKVGYEVKTGGGKSGLVLDAHIAGAESQGNAFTGHHKAVTVTGKLMSNGKEVGNFTAVRYSMGGAWGGYKGSCTILRACTTKIAQDIAGFVKSPRSDAMLGDAH